MLMQQYNVIQGVGDSQSQGGGLSLRDAIESYITNHKPIQQTVTLNPSGLATDRATLTFQPDGPQEAAVLLSLAFDASPNMVSVASVAASYNLAQFGNPGSNSILLTLPWLRQNIIPPQALILLSRSNLLQFTITNLSFYNEIINITAILGIIPITDLNKILSAYGKRIIDQG